MKKKNARSIFKNLPRRKRFHLRARFARTRRITHPFRVLFPPNLFARFIIFAALALSLSSYAHAQTQNAQTANLSSSSDARAHDSNSSAQTPAQTSQTSDDRLPFMANERAADADAPSATGTLAHTLGALLLIVGLIFAVSWFVRRFGGARFNQAPTDAPSLSVLSTVSLGANRSLALIRFGDRTLLVGATAHAVTLISEAGDETQEDLFDRSTRSAQPRSVAALLSDDETSFDDELLEADKRLSFSAPHANEQMNSIEAHTWFAPESEAS